jgi:hypothetical protein
MGPAFAGMTGISATARFTAAPAGARRRNDIPFYQVTPVELIYQSENR